MNLIPMPTLRFASVRAALILGLTTLTLGGCVSLHSIHEQRQLYIPHVPNAPLDIVTQNGSIEILQSDRRDVALIVDLHGHDHDRVSHAIIRADRLADDTLSVSVNWPGGFIKNDEGASFILDIPNAQGIEAHTSNGNIFITGLSGHANLTSSNGSVTVDRHDGSVFAQTGNGNITAEHISSDIELFTTNGSLVITDVFGTVWGETSNGNIYASTTDGNEGPINLRTSNGRLDLDLGDGFMGILKAYNSNGKITVKDLDARLIQSSRNSTELQIGDSSEESRLETSNGSVRIRGTHTEPMGG